MIGFWLRTVFQLVTSWCILTWCKEQSKSQDFLSLLIRALSPFMRAPPLRPSYVLIPSPWGLGFQHMNLEGTQLVHDSLSWGNSPLEVSYLSFSKWLSNSYYILSFFMLKLHKCIKEWSLFSGSFVWWPPNGNNLHLPWLLFGGLYYWEYNSHSVMKA